jgi:hypothetical protein
MAQRELLSSLGVPESNQLFGTAVTKGYSSLENHAEQIILRNIPEGSTVEDMGFSWGGLQKSIPCVNCEPFVQASGTLSQH